MKNIFQNTECLPDTILESYVENNLSSNECNKVETHLLHCDICQDMVDGLSEMSNTKNLNQIVESLNTKIDKKINNKRRSIGYKQVKYIGLVASIVILIGISIFMGKHMYNNQQMAMVENIEESDKQIINNKKLEQNEKIEKNNIIEETTSIDNNEIIENLKKEQIIEDIIVEVENDAVEIVDIFDDEIEEKKSNKDITLDADFETAPTIEDTNKKVVEESTNLKRLNKNSKDDISKGDGLPSEIYNVANSEGYVNGLSVETRSSVNEEETQMLDQNVAIVNKKKNRKAFWQKSKSKKQEMTTKTAASFVSEEKDVNVYSDPIYTARNYQQLGDYSNSIIYYNQILENKNDPYYYEAKFNKAKILVEEEKQNEALDILNELAQEKNIYQDSAKVLILKLKK